MTARAEAPPASTRLPSMLLVLLGGCSLVILGWVGRQAWLMHYAPFEIPVPVTHTDFEDLLPTQFDYTNLTFPYDELQIGGPPVDGIPSLTAPDFLPAGEAGFLSDADRVIGVTINGESKAYPLRILEWHEAVNDKIGERALLVTYCPLGDASAVFDRRVGGRELEFGISGLLYNSNMLLYDRGTAQGPSLWSQMRRESVSGPMRETPLTALPMEVTTWGDWRRRHPETAVLSDRTAHNRDYKGRPYEFYFSRPQLEFPVKPLDKRLTLKTPVLVVWNKNKSRAYPLDRFSDLAEPAEFAQMFDGHAFTLRYSPEGKSLRVVDADGELNWMYSFWFAWAAFHPEAEISSLPAVP